MGHKILVSVLILHTGSPHLTTFCSAIIWTYNRTELRAHLDLQLSPLPPVSPFPTADLHHCLCLPPLHWVDHPGMDRGLCCGTVPQTGGWVQQADRSVLCLMPLLAGSFFCKLARASLWGGKTWPACRRWPVQKKDLADAQKLALAGSWKENPASSGAVYTVTSRVGQWEAAGDSCQKGRAGRMEEAEVEAITYHLPKLARIYVDPRLMCNLLNNRWDC